MKFCTKCGTKLLNNEDRCPKCNELVKDNGKTLNTNIKPNNLNFEENKNINSNKDTNFNNSSDNNTKKNISNNSFTNNKNNINSKPINEIPKKMPNESDIKTKKTNSSESKPLNKKPIIIALVIMLFLGIGFKIGNTLTSSERIVNKFEKAVASNNIEDIKSLVSCEDSRLSIDEENLKILLNYFKENPSYLNEVMSTLKNQSKEISITKDKTLKEHYTGDNRNSILNLRANGKKLLFFTAYTLDIKPEFININVKCENAKILLNGKEIVTSNSNDFNKELGPLMPGKYKVSANFKGKYTKLNDLKEVDYIKDRTSEDRISVFLLGNAKYITLECTQGYEDAQLFVNGKDTGLTVNQTKNFGPVDEHSKIYAVKKVDNKTLKSEEVEIGNSTLGYLNFSYAEEAYSNVEYQLNYLLRNYTDAFAQAVNYNDFSIVEPYIYPGSNLYKTQKKAVPQIASKGITERCINSKVISYTCNNDKTEGSLKELEDYEITQNGKTKTKSFNYTYYFKYNPSTATYQLTDLKDN